MAGMNRLCLIMIGLCVLLFASCKKADDNVIINENQADIDDKIVLDYLAANGLLDKVKRIPPREGQDDTIGVWYQVLEPGPVATPYNSNSSRVTVGYTGRLLAGENAGKVFAQTDDFHPSFSLGEVIKGWQLGIPLVDKGGLIRLFITSRYAYGPYAQTELKPIPLPANAVLDFEIRVFDVTN